MTAPLESSVEQLKSQILSGSVITSVEKTGEGHVITLSNNKSYLIKDGVDGKDGKDGTDGEAILADIKFDFLSLYGSVHVIQP